MKGEFNIYTDIPEEFSGKYIRFNDAHFDLYTYRLALVDDIVRKLVESIDNCEVTDINNWEIRTPTHTSINMCELSTGCKTAINAHFFPDHLINGYEMGGNALKYLLKYVNGANLRLRCPRYIEPELVFSIPVKLHTKSKVLTVKNDYDLHYYLEDLYKGADL